MVGVTRNSTGKSQRQELFRNVMKELKSLELRWEKREAGPGSFMCHVILFAGLSACCPGLIINSTFVYSCKCPH